MAGRSSRRGLSQWLAETDQPVFVVDRRRVVIFFNQGCETLTGWAASDVIGQKCEFRSDSDERNVDAVTGALCPPPEAFAGEALSKPVQFAARDGVPRPWVVHFVPLTAAEAKADVAGATHDVPRVLGMILPPAAAVRLSGPNGHSQLHVELASLKAELRKRYDFAAWIAVTPEMRRVSTQMEIARSTDCAVLFLGERGVGKEHAARTIHYEGPHRLKTFVPVDCRLLGAEELGNLIRRFFVTEEGDPHIPIVQPGTLFLRNVEKLPRELQQFLVEQFPSGPRSDGRRLFVSSRQADLDVEGEPFLAEFRSLVTPVVIRLPPLRQRQEELSLLSQLLLEEGNRRADFQMTGFSPEVLHEFRRYNWPGNVGELAEVILAIREAAASPVVRPTDLPFRFRTGMHAQRIPPAEETQIVPLDELLERTEREQIEAALSRAGGNKSIAADLLRIPRAKLYRRMEALGLGGGAENASEE
ncbi:sigma 54-interacting transcriptional regulator [Planctomyces sp. SH-PL14]|uniref:sigma 54-interacting transcriptional regulator n=1 Tax=Planctomyces sp. SH-PL14 TaxID=1632864 RepID=UPI00078E995A|nr:sigma 54-interacting transcriptional regulator [Planctomyces sp. SH-PL14]AMV18151.1 Arginine utilization regulatory protein RocR [Planctomyces sp. SH-PL14]